MITKKHVKNIFNSPNMSPSISDIRLKRYNSSNEEHIDEIIVTIGSYSYCFYCNSMSLCIDNNSNSRCYELEFDEWKKIFDNLNLSANRNIIKYLGISLFDFNLLVFDFEDMFELVKNQHNPVVVLSEGVNLVPLDDLIEISEIKDQNWYKKLLQDYTEYYQSSSKSDIVDRHYHEQARLHGLKFVIIK